MLSINELEKASALAPLCRLTQLEDLEMSCNLLKELPGGGTAITTSATSASPGAESHIAATLPPSLRRLVLDSNQLECLPDGFAAGMPFLEHLDLGGNVRLCALPKTFSTLPSLRTLRVSFTPLGPATFRQVRMWACVWLWLRLGVGVVVVRSA